MIRLGNGLLGALASETGPEPRQAACTSVSRQRRSTPPQNDMEGAPALIYRWIAAFEDGDVVPVKERLVLSLLKRMIAEGGSAYCSDLTVRKVVGVSRKRCDVRDLLGAVLGPAWSAEPSFSDPVRPYEVEELRSVVERTFVRWAEEDGISAVSARRALSKADSYEAVCRLLAYPPGGL